MYYFSSNRATLLVLFSAIILVQQSMKTQSTELVDKVKAELACLTLSVQTAISIWNVT